MAESKPTVPTEREIGKLPRWARVAFAARCARRVQPCFDLPETSRERPNFLKAVDDAISGAETASANATPATKSLELITASAGEAASKARALIEYPDAAAAVAKSAGSANQAAFAATTHEASRTAHQALESALTAARNADFQLDASEIAHATADAVADDFGRMLAFAEDGEWNDDTPVDHWEVLGQLWPKGRPKKLSDYPEPIRDRVPELARLNYRADHGEESENDATVPTEKEIAELPRWAMVAFAARCARRVQLLYDLPLIREDRNRHLFAVNDAITRAEEAASNAALLALSTTDAADSARIAADAARSVDNSTASIAADAAARAVRAAGTEVEVDIAATVAANAKAASTSDAEAVRGDFRQLYNSAREHQWTAVSPVNHWELCGALWPDGAPEGWPEDYPEPIRDEIPELARLNYRAGDEDDSEIDVTVPTTDEIGELPRWAIVAFAARCARRVQPFYDLPSNYNNREKHLTAVNAAITIAEDAADAADDNDVAAYSAARAADAADAAADAADDNDVAAYSAAFAAARAASAARATNSPYDSAFASYSAAANAANAARATNSPYNSAFADAARTVLRQDFEVLKEAAKQKEWTDDSPVDHWEVCGPLWPNGAPEEWPEDYPEPIRDQIPELARLHPQTDAAESDQIKLLRAELESFKAGTGVDELFERLTARFDTKTDDLVTRAESVINHLALHEKRTEGVTKEISLLQDNVKEAGTSAQDVRDEVTRTREYVAKLIKATNNADKRALELESGIEGHVTTLSKEVEARIESLREEINEKVRAVVDSKLMEVGSSDAVKYWEAEKKKHDNQFDDYRETLKKVGGWGAVGLVVLFIIFFFIFRGSMTSEGSGMPWYLGITVFCTTVFLLALRIITKVMMSHLHLSHEAAERAVMARTYLTLQALGRLPPDQQSLMLNALFRPSSTGLIKDDTVPSSLPDVIVRGLGGSK